MGELAKQQDAIAADGIGLAAISSDSREDSVKFAARIGARFPLLADSDASVAADYGVKQAGETLAVPATFIVDRQGMIVWRHIGESKPDRPAVDRVREQASASR